MAVIAFFSALFRYDSLLMPTGLWPSTPPGAQHARLGVFARPPSSAAWVLFQNMMVIWLRGFTVACVLVALGSVLVIIALSDPTGWRGWNSSSSSLPRPRCSAPWSGGHETRAGGRRLRPSKRTVRRHALTAGAYAFCPQTR